MLPLLRLAAMSQQPEQFCNYPSAENVSSLERVEGYVRVGVAWLAIWPEHRPVRGARSSRIRCRLGPHAKVEKMYLSMFAFCHHNGVGCFPLRFVSRPVQPDVIISGRQGRSSSADASSESVVRIQPARPCDTAAHDIARSKERVAQAHIHTSGHPSVQVHPRRLAKLMRRARPSHWQR